MIPDRTGGGAAGISQDLRTGGPEDRRTGGPEDRRTGGSVAGGAAGGKLLVFF